MERVLLDLTPFFNPVVKFEGEGYYKYIILYKPGCLLRVADSVKVNLKLNINLA